MQRNASVGNVRWGKSTTVKLNVFRRHCIHCGNGKLSVWRTLSKSTIKKQTTHLETDQKSDGRSGCGLAIKRVDEDKWMTMGKIAVPLKTCTAMAAEIAEAIVLTGLLDLLFDKKPAVQKSGWTNNCFSTRKRTDLAARNHLWTSNVRYEVDVAPSCAMAVMDGVGGWILGNEEGSHSGAVFAASMWICTKAVICNGQRHMETFRMNKMNSIMEAINCICAHVQKSHDWISEFSLVMQETKVVETLSCVIDVPCVVQHSMLWFSAPTSLNNDSLNDCVVFDKYSDTISLAITLKACCMRSTRRTLERMLEQVWAPEREMKKWELGSGPDPQTENEDDGLCHQRSVRKMGRRSPSSSSSQRKRTKMKVKLLKKAMSSKWVRRGHQKAGKNARPLQAKTIFHKFDDQRKKCNVAIKLQGNKKVEICGKTEASSGKMKWMKEPDRTQSMAQ